MDYNTAVLHLHLHFLKFFLQECLSLNSVIVSWWLTFSLTVFYITISDVRVFCLFFCVVISLFALLQNNVTCNMIFHYICDDLHT